MKQYNVILNYFDDIDSDDDTIISRVIATIDDDEMAQRLYGDAHHECNDTDPDSWVTYEEVKDTEQQLKEGLRPYTGKENLYIHKDFNIRCKIVEVFTYGRVICRNKQGTTFECEIGDLQRIQ